MAKVIKTKFSWLRLLTEWHISAFFYFFQIFPSYIGFVVSWCLQWISFASLYSQPYPKVNGLCLLRWIIGREKTHQHFRRFFSRAWQQVELDKVWNIEKRYILLFYECFVAQFSCLSSGWTVTFLSYLSLSEIVWWNWEEWGGSALMMEAHCCEDID